LKIHTDGSCLNVGQPNACSGSSIFFGNHSHPLNTAVCVTGAQTNNHSELLAVLIAIQKTHCKCHLEIHSNSQYTICSIVYHTPKEVQSNWLYHPLDCPSYSTMSMVTQIIPTMMLQIPWLSWGQHWHYSYLSPPWISCLPLLHPL
ncbi:hypothetical protein EV368DRAFT_42292, partial [Lentinula lateritia]